MSEYMTAKEVADLLQMHIVTIYRLAERGQLPAFKVGKQWRFREAAIIEWAQAQERRQVRVLIVDDEEDIREVMSANLEGMGCRVQACASGEEAVVAAGRTDFHLAFIDLKLEGMDGVEVMRQLGEKNPRTSIVIITGYPTDELVAEAAALGPVTILTKPLDAAVVERIVAPMLARTD
jgi:excisionase family DNA binding protein